MKYSLDSNTVIALLNNDRTVINKVKFHNPNDFVISSIVMFELYFGAQKSKRTKENLAKLDKMQFPVLDFNESDGQVAGRLRNELNAKGTPIGAYDLLIAGQAVNRGLIVISNNVREFSRVAELKWEDWIA